MFIDFNQFEQNPMLTDATPVRGMSLTHSGKEFIYAWSLVSRSPQLFSFFFEKNGRANAVLSALFYVLYSAKLWQMSSSAIFVAIIYVVKLWQMEIFINCN